MIEPEMSAIPSVVVISLLLSFFLSLTSPLLSLYLLPLPMMIGPIFSLPIEGVVNITAGDLYAVIFIGRTLFLRGFRLKKTGHISLLLGTLLLVLSAALSYDVDASVVGLTKIVEFALLVRGSIILIEQPSDFRNLFTSWVFITTLCAIMMLWHYYNGRPQMISWTSASETGTAIDFYRSHVLFRPTFFYANIFLALGLSLLYSLMSILVKVEPGAVKRVLLCITIPINLIALLMNNTRAMLFPVTVLSGLIVLWFCWKSLTWTKPNLRMAAFLALITGVSIWFFVGNLITGAQLAGFFERSSDPESLTMRWNLWVSFLPKMADDPLRLLVGYGPQSTVRQLNESYMQVLLTGLVGNVEGAFDSTIVGFLVEYGIIFSVLVLAYIAFWFSHTWGYYKSTGDALAPVLLVMATAIVFAHIFQQFGLGPPGLMALQVFAFLPIFKKTI